MPRSFTLVGIVAVTSLLAAPATSQACQICLPYPTESLADRILAAEHLALAREDPERPFTLTAVDWLKRGAVNPPALELFLDSSSRRRLSTDESLTILCGWFPEKQEWRRLALHDDSLAPVIAGILENAELWRDAPTERVRFFADYLGHESGVLSDLAHLEVAGAPYSELLRHADRIPRDELLAGLGNIRRLEWHALYILFLSQSGHPEDHERIRHQLAQTARFGLTTQAAAWATAALEIDGADAVTRLREWYVAGGDRRIEERQAVFAALAVHGSKEEGALRDSIVEFLGDLLRAEPELAPAIAAQMNEWQRDDLNEAIAVLLRESPERYDMTETLAIRRYLRAAEVRTVEAPDMSTDPSPTAAASLSGPAAAAEAPTDRKRPPLPLLIGVILLTVTLLLAVRRRISLPSRTLPDQRRPMPPSSQADTP